MRGQTHITVAMREWRLIGGFAFSFVTFSISSTNCASSTTYSVFANAGMTHRLYMRSYQFYNNKEHATFRDKSTDPRNYYFLYNFDSSTNPGASYSLK